VRMGACILHGLIGCLDIGLPQALCLRCVRITWSSLILGSALWRRAMPCFVHANESHGVNATTTRVANCDYRDRQREHEEKVT
jgi:hypothetical protein